MKCRFAKGLLAGLGLLAAAGAASAQELLVAADVGYVPHVFQKPDGTYDGFNVDLVNAIAAKMKRPVKIIDQQWSGIFAGLNAKKYEFIIAPATITKERAESLLMTEGYLETDHQFVIKKGAPEITKLDDLKGKVIAVNNGNLYDRWATEREGEFGWTVQRYGKNADAVQAVLTGRAAANMVGSTVGGWLEKSTPMLKRSLVIPTGQVFGIPFRKEDTAGRDRVEKILECLKTEGVIAKLHEKWMGFELPKTSVGWTPKAGMGEPGFDGYDATPHPAACA